MKRQKSIGIIGGVGPQATAYLYDALISQAQTEYNARKNDEFPRVIIVSEPVTDFISSTDRLDVSRQQVLDATERLISAGATCVAIASNTVHLLYDEVQNLCEAHGVESISMIEAVAEHCKNNHYGSVGLLASPVTIQKGVYKEALGSAGITLIQPSEHDYPQLGCIIKKVISDSISSDDRNNFEKIRAKIAQKSDAVILGCTELPLVYQSSSEKDAVVNSTKILATTLLAHYYQH